MIEKDKTRGLKTFRSNNIMISSLTYSFLECFTPEL